MVFTPKKDIPIFFEKKIQIGENWFPWALGLALAWALALALAPALALALGGPGGALGEPWGPWGCPGGFPGPPRALGPGPGPGP